MIKLKIEILSIFAFSISVFKCPFKVLQQTYKVTKTRHKRGIDRLIIA